MERRRGQAEIKSSLKLQLTYYLKYFYCETGLVFDDFMLTIFTLQTVEN